MDASAPPHETRLRVRYGEVDRMGVVYHGHYLVFFEQGRTELLRSLGVTYRQVEDAGTLLVVVEAGLRCLRPARYDDELLVRTRLTAARGVRLRFEYEVVRGPERLATGHTVLASTDRGGRPQRLPADLRGRIDAAATGLGTSELEPVQGASGAGRPTPGARRSRDETGEGQVHDE